MARHFEHAHPMRHHRQHEHKEWKRKSRLGRKLAGLVLTAAAIFFLYYYRLEIFEAMKQYPVVWQVYSYASGEIAGKTLMGLFISVALASLFFVTIPAELIFLFYLTTSHNPLLVIAFTVLATIAGYLVNYLIGLVIGERILRFFVGNFFFKVQRWIERFGGAVIIVGNIFPFPMPIATVLIGAVRYSLAKFIIFSAVGAFLKCVIMLLAKDYIMSNVLPYLSGIL